MTTGGALTRRAALVIPMATLAVAGCAPEEPAAPPQLTYGSDASQFVELTLPAAPATRPYPVAVLVHGGFWRAEYGAEYARPLSPSLVERGWATLVIEYRRVGDGGGWPMTFDDVAAAVDLLADAAATGGAELDLTRVVAIGHSAGGHLAGWLGSRPTLPDGAPGAAPAVSLAGVVSQAGVLDLRTSAAQNLGGGAAQALLGGSAEVVPERYDLASPIERLPLGVPSLCIHARDDAIVPVSQSESFVAAAQQAGDEAELHVAEGDHFVVIDPESEAWQPVLTWLERFES